jgi:hypothetical protein
MIVLRPDEMAAARGAYRPDRPVVCLERLPPGHPPRVWLQTREAVQAFAQDVGGGPAHVWRPPTCGALLDLDPRERGFDAWLVVYFSDLPDADNNLVATVIGLPHES